MSYIEPQEYRPFLPVRSESLGSNTGQARMPGLLNQKGQENSPDLFGLNRYTRPTRRVVQAVCFHAGVRALSSFEDPRPAPLEPQAPESLVVCPAIDLV